MPRPSPDDSTFDPLTFAADADLPIYQQIYARLREAMLAGRLEKGASVPSTRALAELIAVSRNTVLAAYDQLAAEGYLERVPGRGTFVARFLPDDAATPEVRRRRSPPPRGARQLSARTRALDGAPVMAVPSYPPTPDRLAFAVGIPALDAFPYERWGRIVTHQSLNLTPEVLNYPFLAGYTPLRDAIARHVTVTRQIWCERDQVMITAGSREAVYLAALVLTDPGDPVWVEDPGYPLTRRGLLAAGARLVPVPVDEHGILVETGISRAPEARLALVTPSHQFPLGATLSLERRVALLDWARRSDAHVIEDDYDGEYRFGGRPLAALQSLDPESVIHVGTFSKTMFPSLRIGYLIIPVGLVDAFRDARRSVSSGLAHLEQAALAEFIAEGHFTRHVRRMRTLYAERRAVLLEAAAHLPLDLQPPDTGMYMVGWLPDGVDDRAIAERAGSCGVDVDPVSALALEPIGRGGLVLGFGSLDRRQIAEGVRRLGEALESFGLRAVTPVRNREAPLGEVT